MDIPCNDKERDVETQFDMDMNVIDPLDDTIDSGLIENFVPTRLGSHASSSSLPAGEMLMSPLPKKKTGEEVIDSFIPRKDHKRDSTVSADEVMRDLEPVVFKTVWASKAVKHFFSAELVSVDQSTPSPSDRVDAGGDISADEDDDYVDLPPSEQTPLAVTSEQHRGAEPIARNISTLENDFRYKMNRPQRGCFVIFNHFTFDYYNEGRREEDHLQERKGTDKDALNLENTAKQLGFEFVKIIYDATKSEITQWIQTLATADHSNYDCFACAILTHGGDRDILYARDEKMNLRDFTRPFGADRCPSLAAKPKLFFIQACRGSMFDPGKKLVLLCHIPDSVDGRRKSSGGDAVDGGGEKEVIIPAEADFLIANSTVPEYYSWRNESNGSFFVQSLCAVLNQYGDNMELMQMMTRVNRMVGYDFESSTSDDYSNNKKQIPSIATRLTAEVFFTPKVPNKRGSTIQASCSPPSTNISYLHCEESVSQHTPDGTSHLVMETSSIQLQSAPVSRYPTGGTNFFAQEQPPLPPKTKKFYPDPKPSSPSRRKGHSQKATLTPQNSPSQVSLTPPYSSNQDLFSRGLTSAPIGVPFIGSRYIPGGGRLNDSRGYSRSFESKPMHRCQTVPKNVEFLRTDPRRSPRQTEHRHSLPDNKRLVVQDRDHLLKVAGRKTNQYFVESEI